MKVELRHQFSIESARFLPHLPIEHPCRHTHGHSFKITVVLRGECDPKTGWLMDYHELSKICQNVLKNVDHKLLNEVPGLSNPTTENLTAWLFENLKKNLKDLSQVQVSETDCTLCVYPI